MSQIQKVDWRGTPSLVKEQPHFCLSLPPKPTATNWVQVFILSFRTVTLDSPQYPSPVLAPSPSICTFLLEWSFNKNLFKLLLGSHWLWDKIQTPCDDLQVLNDLGSASSSRSSSAAQLRTWAREPDWLGSSLYKLCKSGWESYHLGASSSSFAK